MSKPRYWGLCINKFVEDSVIVFDVKLFTIEAVVPEVSIDIALRVYIYKRKKYKD